MPGTPPNLRFSGRKEELELLNGTWSKTGTLTQTIRVLVLVAGAGVGKTTLINEWLRQMGERQYAGADHVFAWSYYTQGANTEQQSSAEIFYEKALSEFGESDLLPTSNRVRAERIANYMKRRRVLLVLDGLEPLQYNRED
jgi:hypothetical protein